MIPNKTYYFISDIHLGLRSPEVEKETEKKLVKLINHAQDSCDELFIIGDLFDYWFEYKRVIQKGFIKTLASLADFTESGKKIHYIIGNHDFLHRDFFEKEIGAVLYHDPIDIRLNGKKFFMAHGDGMVKNDLGYQILKKILRNKTLQKIYSLVHPDLGIKIASATSKSSRDYTANKNYGTVDGLFETAKTKIDSGFDYVIFGHSHNRTLEKYKEGYYINLGSWLDQPCFGKFIETFEIIDWE
ncbi:MAG: UDP-2,3-diacylglucosamine diphosphatase [Ignavibacteriales bacterium]|nr:UDP-2,3-diacylglucosamine diphosphatase [Ignavibacteriales bacterium]